MHPKYSERFPSRIVETDKRSWLYFGGTAYLGLQSDPEFQDIFVRNIRRFGTSHGASRSSNVRFSVFEKAEATLSDWTGSEDALTLSSGYLAGQLVCQSLRDSGHQLFHLPGAHPALRIEAVQKPVQSFDQLKQSLESAPSPALLLDSIDFRGKHFPGFEVLKQLPLERAILVADDSHGLGVSGNGGQGSIESLQKIKAKELLICGSLNKGLAIQAGVILGSKQRLAELRQTSLFAGASPASPASMATFIEAQQLYHQRHEKLLANLAAFEERNKVDRYFEYNLGHCAFSAKSTELAAHLENTGILVTRFSYPAATEAEITRIIVSAAHKPEDLEKLANALDSFS